MTWKFWERWTKRTKPAPKRYPRAACEVCGKVVAQTINGAWKHECVSVPVVVKEQL